MQFSVDSLLLLWFNHKDQSTLPSGNYSGSQLSGGRKKRVATEWFHGYSMRVSYMIKLFLCCEMNLSMTMSLFPQTSLRTSLRMNVRHQKEVDQKIEESIKGRGQPLE